jgi:hypothetical protein
LGAEAMKSDLKNVDCASCCAPVRERNCDMLVNFCVKDLYLV